MLEPERIPTLIVAIVLLGIAAWVLFLRPDSRLHRAFSALLVVKGSISLFLALDDRIHSATGLATPYLWIALPFVAIHFGLTFWQENHPSRRHHLRGWDAVLLIGLVICESMWMWDHSLFWWSWLGLFQTGTFVVSGALAALLALVYLRQAPVDRNRALLPLIVGFSLEPIFFPLIYLQGALEWGFGQGVLFADNILVLIALGLPALVLVGFFITAIRQRDDLLHADALQFSILLILAAVTSIWVYQVVPNGPLGDQAAMRLFGTQGIWQLATAMYLAYAVVRYEVFGIDLRLKAAISYGTMASGFAVAYFVMAEFAENILNIDGPYLGVPAAAMMALGIRPMMMMTDRFSNQLMPGVEHTEAYRSRRSREIYVAAVRRAMADGVVTPHEGLAIRSMGGDLGLAEPEMLQLEKRIAGTALV